MPNETPSAVVDRAIRLRGSRDRLVDLLGFGETYPLQDVSVRAEDLIVPIGTTAKIPVDPGQLESAILNLAINSRDAMPDGGVLTIATASGDYQFPAEISPEIEEGTRNAPIEGTFAVIAVSDTGTGISPENIDKVWEPFFTTKGVGEGSGLGLSMVYGFVKQSGGQLEIDSTQGTGTTVKLYLPVFVSEQP